MIDGYIEIKHMGGVALEKKSKGQVLLGVLSPHPPLLIPGVGGGRLAKVECTRRAMESMAEAVRELAPDVIVVISPHGPILPDGIGIWAIDTLSGDFGQFGAKNVTFNYKNDTGLLERVMMEGQALDYSLREVDEAVAHTYRWPLQMDYATLVPLYYVDAAGVKTPILAMGMGFLPNRELYQFGIILKKAIQETGRRAVVIASGDLSHRLTKDAPAGYSETGQKFDQTLWQLLTDGDVQGILNIDPKLVNAAGECGYRSLVMMLGCFEGQAIRTTPLSYEGPFGVGYGVCLVERKDSGEAFLVDGKAAQQVLGETRCGKGDKKHPLVQLAKNTVEALVKGEPPPSVADVDLPSGLPRRAGVFVTLRKGGQLRGCIGTITPTYPSLAQEVMANARQAAFSDPRFSPVASTELLDLGYSVDVLGEPEPIGGMEDLDPKRFGVIVEASNRRGLLLPNLADVNSAETQVAIARRKAGIRPEEKVKLYRFEVERYH
jgi:AmmeMemoRadiSam system protein A